ncbi:MAG: T9SS type A sorting domain-containing protein, partial [Bacteroidota bacterium]
MNKILLSAICLCFVFLTGSKSFSQCTPDPNNHSLITPDTTTNFASGIVTHPYSQVIYIHPPADTTVTLGTISVHVNPVDSVVLNNISNLPPGLSLSCNPNNCVFLGGVSGCANISGIPTTAGNYILDVIVTAYGHEATFGFAVFYTDTIHAYHINISNNTGIPEANSNSNFQLLNLEQNQLLEKLILTMNAPVSATADFSVFNILGKNVYSKPTALKKGENEIEFNTKNLPPGVYIFTLKKDTYILSRRFVIGG